MSTAIESGVELSEADGIWQRVGGVTRLFYWGVHGGCLAALWTGVDATALTLFVVTFWIRIFAITGGFHRYFAHKSYKTSRGFQFLLGLLATSAAQKGPLWWAGIHRLHHRFSDHPGDPHSPKEGFYYSHQGWVFDPRWNGTPLESIPDLARYPELHWLNRWHFLPVVALAVVCFAIGGWSGLVWGFAISTTLTWHSTYCVNSICHLFGSRRYETGDTSRNNWWVALLTLGEGWHNNHHHYMASTRQGFRWWELDVTYYILRGLAALGLIWDLREPPAAALEVRSRQTPSAEEPARAA